MDHMDNHTDYMAEESDTPRLVVCDLGGVNWIKVAHDMILVNRTYVFQIERNRRGG